MTNPHGPMPYPEGPVPPQTPAGATYPQGPIPPQIPGRPPYPRPPVPPKKSNSTLIIALSVVGGFILLCGLGGALSGNNDNKADSKTTAASSPVAAAPAPAASSLPTTKPVPTEPPAKPAPPGLNTPVRDGKFEFVVTNVQNGLSIIGDNPYLQKKAQGSYSIVSITVRNIGSVPQGFSPGNQYVYDAQNRRFTNDASAAINLQADTSLYAEINPGNSVTAQVVFDLPAGDVPDRIVLHDSMFSGGATVSLR
ncbi:hypothetical protein ABIA39_001278 [Nocardia sp. GAS34]|uniref:DUF4352 domain-containing protein n=1 Tax=unclassified Nocardia TaxID=2637762 RepID=UPI003D1A1013